MWSESRTGATSTAAEAPSPHRPGPMRQAFLCRTKRGLRFCVHKTPIVPVAYRTGAIRNFGERRKAEVGLRRIVLPRTSANRGRRA
jgi:hypothetical protein